MMRTLFCGRVACFAKLRRIKLVRTCGENASEKTAQSNTSEEMKSTRRKGRLRRHWIHDMEGDLKSMGMSHYV